LIHCGWGYLTGKMPTAEEWNWSVEGMREIAGYAQETSGLAMGIEAVNRFESHLVNTAADAVRLVRAIGLPNVKVHLDTFHMIREEVDMPAAVRATGSYVGYVHACENQRGIPGTGMVPWVPFFEALREIGYDGCVTIESFDPGLESVVKLCCIWRKLADSPEQLATEGLRFLKGVYRQAYLRETVASD
jgi:D-psicose/D-tagatose/L-ribulose 3-epimerase